MKNEETAQSLAANTFGFIPSVGVMELTWERLRDFQDFNGLLNASEAS